MLIYPAIIKMSLAADQWLGPPPPKLSKGGKYRLSGRRFSVALQESPPSSQMDNYNIFRSSCSSDTSSPGSFALKTSESGSSRGSAGDAGDAPSPGSQQGSFALKNSDSRSSTGRNSSESPGSGCSDEAVSSGASSPGSSPRLAPAVVELMPPPPPPYTFHSTAARRRATELYPLIEVAETAGAVRPGPPDGTTTPGVSASCGYPAPAAPAPEERSSYKGATAGGSEQCTTDQCTTDLCTTDLIQYPVPVTLEDKLAISERIQAAMETELTVCRESLARVEASVGSGAGLMDVGELKLRVVFATVAAVQAAQNSSHFHAAGLLYAGQQGGGAGGGTGGAAAGWTPAVRDALASMDALRKATSTCAFTAGCSLLRLLAVQAREYRAVLTAAASAPSLQDAARPLPTPHPCMARAAEYNLRSISATVADVAHNTRVAAWAVDGSSASVSQLERACAAAQRSPPLQLLAATTATRVYAYLLSPLYSRLASAFSTQRTPSEP